MPPPPPAPPPITGHSQSVVSCGFPGAILSIAHYGAQKGVVAHPRPMLICMQRGDSSTSVSIHIYGQWLVASDLWLFTCRMPSQLVKWSSSVTKRELALTRWYYLETRLKRPGHPRGRVAPPRLSITPVEEIGIRIHLFPTPQGMYCREGFLS